MNVASDQTDRATLAATISRLSEVAAVLLAVGYGLGVLSLAGQLRQLGLHQPTVLSGFAHDDVLMKGIGVLVTHVPSLVAVTLLIALALSSSARAWIHSVTAPGAARSAPGHRVRGSIVATQLALALLFVSALLASAWWEETLAVVLVYGYIAVSWRSSRLMTPGTLLAAVVVGSLAIGLVGAFLHPAPLPQARIVTTDDQRIRGELLGTGQRGEWYLVVRDGSTDRDARMRLVPDKSVVRVQLDEPTDDAPRTLLEHLRGS